MYDIEEARQIQFYLDQQDHNWQGLPIFRLVWADDQFEYREGDFNEFKGDLFLRTIHGIKKTPKYPHLKGCWILEMWHEPNKVQTSEIKDHNGYECLYAFKRNFKPLPLRLAVVQIILKAKKTHISPSLRKSIMTQDLEDKEKRQDQYVYDAIDPSSPIESALHFGEGISLAGLGDKNADTKTSDASYTTKSGK